MKSQEIKEKEFCALLGARGYDELIVEGIATGKFRLIARVDGKPIYFKDLKGQIETFNKIEQADEAIQYYAYYSGTTLWNVHTN